MFDATSFDCSLDINLLEERLDTTNSVQTMKNYVNTVQEKYVICKFERTKYV